MSFLLHTLQSGDLFVDVGANVGSYSILAGACKGVNVLSFKPIPSTFFHLQKNIKLNSLDNQVIAMNIGLADQKGSRHFSLDLDIDNHVILNNEKNYPSIEIDVERMDDVLDKKCPTMIKIDVEGYETQVLEGAKKIINNPTLVAVIVELNKSGKKYGKDDNDIHELLISKGFDCFQYDPFKYQLKSLQGKFNQISNTLYLRNLGEIQRRLSNKNTFTLGTGQKI
jgi:FkbM family methyltransferase